MQPARSLFRLKISQLYHCQSVAQPVKVLFKKDLQHADAVKQSVKVQHNLMMRSREAPLVAKSVHSQQAQRKNNAVELPRQHHGTCRLDNAWLEQNVPAGGFTNA